MQALPEPFINPAKYTWRKLRSAWLNQAASDHAAQSTWRFMLRVALTPVMLINDHIDYRFLFKNPGYWGLNSGSPTPDPKGMKANANANGAGSSAASGNAGSAQKAGAAANAGNGGENGNTS